MPSASSALVSSAVRGHRIPSRVRDDREPPLDVERDGGGYKSDLPAGASTISENQNIFSKEAGRVLADLPRRVHWQEDLDLGEAQVSASKSVR